MKNSFLSMALFLGLALQSAAFAQVKNKASKESPTFKLREALKESLSQISDLADSAGAKKIDPKLVAVALESAAYLANEKDTELYYAAESLLSVEKNNPELFKLLFDKIESREKAALKEQFEKAKKDEKEGNA